MSLAAATIAPDETVLHDKFIIKAKEDVRSSFVTPGPAVDYTLDYTAESYSLTVTRNAYASSFAADNGADYLSALEKFIAGKGDVDTGTVADGYEEIALLVAQADVMPTASGIRDYAGRMARSSTVQGTANTVFSVLRANRLAGEVFADNLRLAGWLDSPVLLQSAFTGLRGNAYASMAAGYAAPAPYMVWARPFYHYGKLDGASGYSDLKENIGGGSVGFAYRRDRTVLGLAGHYLYTDIDGQAEYQSHYQGFGFNLGLGHAFDLGAVAPRIDLTGGWSRYQLDQQRRDRMLGGTANSKPDIDVWNASLLASARFNLGCGASSLTPELGMDFSYASTDGYTERVAGAANSLRVGKEHVTSVRGVLGIRYEYRATDRISLSARGRYHHEFADRRAFFSSRTTSGLPFSFRTRGQDAGRETGMVGVGIKARITGCSDLGLDYDLHLGKDYVGHRVSASLRWAF
ncbi:MAG: autotransporter outer membrane beta-barrel domain-containing protein [Planctomycetes bacterium]|nr:autotransporter outer membrane beta-barrel domain-containing protein [Planctomycetota bacterium]